MEYKTIVPTKILNKLPPNGSDMGVLAKGVVIFSDQMVDGWRHFLNAQGQHRWVRAVDTAPNTPPPPVEPPKPTDRLFLVMELIDNVWTSVGYFKKVDVP